MFRISRTVIVPHKWHVKKLTNFTLCTGSQWEYHIRFMWWILYPIFFSSVVVRKSHNKNKTRSILVWVPFDKINRSVYYGGVGKGQVIWFSVSTNLWKENIVIISSVHETLKLLKNSFIKLGKPYVSISRIRKGVEQLQNLFKYVTVYVRDFQLLLNSGPSIGRFKDALSNSSI